MKLIIPTEVYDKIQHWMGIKPLEVSGMGNLLYDEETETFTVEDVFLLEQTVSSASTELTAESMNKMSFKTKDHELGMKWHWHSHVNMGVFWSGDDRSLIKDMAMQGWIMATVFNLKGEMRTCLATSHTFMGKSSEIFYDNIPTETLSFYDADLFKAWDKEYEDHVRVEKYSYPSRYNRGAGDKILAPDYDDWGYSRLAKVNGFNFDRSGSFWNDRIQQWIYSPVHDQSLETHIEKLEAFVLLDQDDLDILLKEVPDSLEFYKRYKKEIEDERVQIRAFDSAK